MQIIKVDNFLELSTPLVGIYDNIPPDIYRSLPGISRSELLDINRSILYWKNRPPYSSGAMDFGTLVHDVIMFPENIKNYAFELDLPRRSAKDKEIHAEFEEQNKGKKIIEKGATKDDMPEVALKKILENIEKNKFVKQFLNADYCKFEHSIFWVDPETKILCKCRPDIIFNLNDTIFIFDIKTSKDASYNSFRYSLKTYKYHVQASYYSEGIKQVTGANKIIFGFIVIETANPYDIAVYDLDDSTIQASKTIWQEGLRRYAKYLKDNVIEGYELKLKTISLKDYEI